MLETFSRISMKELVLSNPCNSNMLATWLETLRLGEVQAIAEFNGMFRHIANRVFQLGKYSKAMLVRELLCSLPERFTLEVATIEDDTTYVAKLLRRRKLNVNKN